MVGVVHKASQNPYLEFLLVRLLQPLDMNFWKRRKHKIECKGLIVQKWFRQRMKDTANSYQMNEMQVDKYEAVQVISLYLKKPPIVDCSG